MYYKWVRCECGSGVVVRKMGKNVLGFDGIFKGGLVEVIESAQKRPMCGLFYHFVGVWWL